MKYFNYFLIIFVRNTKTNSFNYFCIPFYRLLLVWKEGAIDHEHKWSKNEVSEIDALLKMCNKCKPKEIHRAVRGLKDLKFWKGTEFRAFLLYFGFVVLKDYLSEEEYNHFLLLACAIRIFYTDHYKKYHEIANGWINRYIESYINIFGSHSIVSNVHNLSHIYDDVKQLGCLMDLSAYPFENRLQFLKLRLKQKNLPLEQMARGLTELSLDYDELFITNISQENFPKLKFPFQLNSREVHKEILIRQDYTISSKKHADSWFLTHSNDVVQMNHVTSENQILIYGTPVEKKEHFFSYPASSGYLDIFQSDGEKKEIESFELKEIKAKMLCLTLNNKFIFIPLLHTLELNQ